MSDTPMPGGLPPEAFSPEVLAQTKRPFAGKQIILIAAAIIIIVLLGLIAWGFTYLLRDSAAPATVSPTPTTSVFVAPVLPPERQRQPGLHVQVQRAAGTDFAVTLLDIHRTNEVPTIHSQEPPVTAPHSLIQLLAIDGTIINEFRFTLPTQVALEGSNIPGVLFDVPAVPFDMIIPVPAGSEPAVVRIVTPSGQVIAERVIQYQQLPDESTTSNDQVNVWLNWFGLVREAIAQVVQPEIKIVVVNHQQADLTALYGAVSDMVSFISPWTLFSPIIRVESVVLNNEDLGCQLFPVGNINYPLCTNSGAVMQAVQRQVEVADWDLIAVAVDENCDCGAAAPNSKIAAFGNFVSPYLVAHEFAHAVPTFLADEYFGDQGRSGPTGPNCFASEVACETALGKVGVGADMCRLGCNTPFTWRPASQLMYNIFTDFGPVEHKLMCEHIADLVGLDCDDAYRLGGSEGMDSDTELSGSGGDGDPGNPVSTPVGQSGANPSSVGNPATADSDGSEPVVSNAPATVTGNNPAGDDATPSSAPTATSPLPSGDTGTDSSTPETPTNGGSNSGNATGFFGGSR